jgi:polysaccharide pyruvyl transferase WcaK-like protein
MIFTPVVTSLYESNSLASYVKYGLHSSFLKAIRPLNDGKKIKRLSLDFSEETAKDILQSSRRKFLRNRTIILEISPDNLIRRIKEIEKLAQNNKNLLEVNIRLENVINDKVNIKNLLKQINELINLINQQDTVKQVIFFTFSLSCTNYYLAEDLMRLFLERKIDGKLFFIPDKGVCEQIKEESDQYDTNSLFGIKIYLESLARSKSNTLAKRQFYKRLIDSLDNGTKECYLPEKFFFPKIPELFSLSLATLKGKFNSLFHPKSKKDLWLASSSEAAISSPTRWKHVLITGWYGTETNGDKAILGELLHFVRYCSPDCCITITSLCKRISIQTNHELHCTHYVDLIDLDKASSKYVIKKYDAVIIGGGPLMESDAMENLFLIFNEANRLNKARIIFGCGIGPIHSGKIRSITKRLVELATAGFLRDEESYKHASQLCPDHKLKWACDPAFAYISRWRSNQASYKSNNDQIKIAGLLRSNTSEFKNHIDVLKLESTNKSVAESIAVSVENTCNLVNANFVLLHMNAPWIGGDDRLFNRMVERSFKVSEKVSCVRKYLTLGELLENLYSTDVSIAMRYHGHIFSMALGIPFLSINYSGKGGKVENLTKRIVYNEWSIPWAEIDVDRASKQLQKLIKQREMLSSYLLEQTNLLTETLYRTYRDVFGVEINSLLKG